MTNEISILKDLKNLLLKDVAATQESICANLDAKGHQVTQSKVSRMLRKLNAIKSKNEQGEMVYRLPHDSLPPPVDTTLSELVINIQVNESLIVIKTSPGAASLIARILDNKKCQILGTIAGDDTIFIAPNSVKTIKHSLSLIYDFLNIKN